MKGNMKKLTGIKEAAISIITCEIQLSMIEIGSFDARHVCSRMILNSAMLNVFGHANEEALGFRKLSCVYAKLPLNSIFLRYLLS